MSECITPSPELTINWHASHVLISEQLGNIFLEQQTVDPSFQHMTKVLGLTRGDVVTFVSNLNHPARGTEVLVDGLLHIPLGGKTIQRGENLSTLRIPLSAILLAIAEATEHAVDQTSGLLPQYNAIVALAGNAVDNDLQVVLTLQQKAHPGYIVSSLNLAKDSAD